MNYGRSEPINRRLLCVLIFYKQERNQTKNALRNETYQRYLIQQQKELNSLAQEQRTALGYQNPSMEALAKMTKELALIWSIKVLLMLRAAMES